MSEYWKSTPRYWCKHCSTYVRDTKLERANHEATARHQSAVKRSLRELHRGHEQEERERERARREVQRLNGVVASSPTTSSSSSLRRDGPGGARDRSGMGGADGAAAAEESRKRQLEQLAEMGVSIPEPLRGEVALAGEWTVTKTKVIEDEDEDEKVRAERRAAGVRKRERTEEEREEDNAVSALFKKPRRWGRDSKALPGDEDEDLDRLLSGKLVKKEESENDGTEVKREEGADTQTEKEGRWNEVESEAKEVKSEGEKLSIKREPTEGDAEGPLGGVPEAKTEGGGTGAEQPVVFKKRKPKNIRQK
ncbi:U1 zinc finger family protein [Pleurostoma richardsiae]|uniref:U1 zinc finger family protein n=1 Tax=Pleurostoma richardsiae TaxID=41990 RepID=A0AA38VPP0_9PEZI|nr:U1 zinc finger family protein [Pleurostoma richardsiae]